MNRTLVFAIILNWLALIASAVLIFTIGDALAPAAKTAALFQLSCLFVAIAMLTAMGASSAGSEEEVTAKVDHHLLSQRMAKVMARQTAWLADAPLVAMREAA